MKPSKILIVSLLSVGILSIITIVVLILRTQILDENLALSDWSIYQNDKYDYKVAYPNGWSVDEVTPEQVSLGQITFEPSAGAMFINIYSNKNILYLDEFKENYPAGCQDDGNTFIAKLRTWRLVCVEPFAGQKTQEYFFERGADLYHIHYIATEPKLNAIFEKMINTFTFNRPPQSINGWKVYRNEIIGIEFEYPSYWPTLKPDDEGDYMVNGKPDTGFTLDLPETSMLSHTYFNFDNLPVDEQYERIKCTPGDPLEIVCDERISANGVKYVWLHEKTAGGLEYVALVPTGKYILIFSFDEPDNYNQRADEYQRLLSTLKIPE